MNLDKKNQIRMLFQKEYELYKKSESNDEEWFRLERLHVIGQMFFFLHFKVHFLMLSLAIKQVNFNEIIGQIMRLCLVIPGHLFQRLPRGNVGSTRVSAFTAMPISEELQSLLD